ncbi:hypothetical protein MUO71_03735, partial [Candidatus Bathyarchaeota archaeon]|nr:hypothetical protein [Candidatus Bathyarchaeota archaeon]
MQNNNQPKHFLDKAKELEKKYDWLGAVDFYEQASSLVSENFLKAAELRERIGFCFFKAAMQAETNEIFRIRTKLAVNAYERTVELLQNVEEKVKEAKINHAKALAAHASSWLERDWTKKGKLLGDWWRLENEALKEYEKAGDLINIGRTCNNLLQVSQEYRFWLTSEWTDFERMIKELLRLGEKSIVTLSSLDDDYELARAYCWTGLYYNLGTWMGVLKDGHEETAQKSVDYSQKALMHSEKTGDAWLIGWSQHLAFIVHYIGTDNIVSAAEFSKKALNHAKITKDHYLLAIATYEVGAVIMSLNVLKEDPEKQREGLQAAMKRSREAINHFHTIAFYGGIMFQNYRHIVASLTYLSWTETNIEARRSVLEKAVEVGREGVKYTEGRVERFAIDAISALSQALTARALVETKVSKKRRLLEESLEYTRKENEIQERGTPFVHFSRITTKGNQVNIHAELAKTEQDKEKKIEHLNNALVPMENAIKLVAEDASLHRIAWMSNVYGILFYGFGTRLNELYALTKDRKILSKSIEVYKGAVENFTKADTTSRVAESYWQIAKVHDRLGDRLESARNYQSAAENYKLAAKKIPQLKGF